MRPHTPRHSPAQPSPPPGVGPYSATQNLVKAFSTEASARESSLVSSLWHSTYPPPAVVTPSEEGSLRLT